MTHNRQFAHIDWCATYDIVLIYIFFFSPDFNYVRSAWILVAFILRLIWLSPIISDWLSSVVHLGIVLVSVSVFHQLVCTIYIACQCIVIYNCFFLSLSFLIVLSIYSHIDFCLMFPYSVVLYQCVFNFGGQEGVPVCVFILAICSLFRAFFTVVLACDFDIFARLSMLILAGSSALHIYICLCQWFLRFVAILFFIELSFSFRILCRYRICFSCIIVSTSHIPVSTWTISRGGGW